jgi:hypothetical protein
MIKYIYIEGKNAVAVPTIENIKGSENLIKFNIIFVRLSKLISSIQRIFTYTSTHYQLHKKSLHSPVLST